MIMKKHPIRILSVLLSLAALLVLSLAGCGENGGSDMPADTAQTSAPETAPAAAASLSAADLTEKFYCF